MSNASKRKIGGKYLKGYSLSASLGDFDVLNAKSLKIETIELGGEFIGGQFIGVIIEDSEIFNTPIGVNGPSVGWFTELNLTGDFVFQSSGGNIATWDASEGLFTISPYLNVTGCATFGNIVICDNFVRAGNPNGDVQIISNELGTIELIGPIIHRSTHGNFASVLDNGSVSFTLNDNFDIFSSTGSFCTQTFLDQKLITRNGDISLTVDSGITDYNIDNIKLTSGNIEVTTTEHHNLKIGDTITISNTGAKATSGTLILDDGVYTVQSIQSETILILDRTTTDVDIGTGGNLIKTPSNNIELNSQNLVKIPENTKLTLGDTCNSISGNTSGLIINSCLDICFDSNLASVANFKIPDLMTINVGDSLIRNSGANLYISNGNTLYIENELTQLNGNLQVFDPILTIADGTTGNNDLRDRGIEFIYPNELGDAELGFFGWKNTSGNFVLLTNATNTDEVINGDLGTLELNGIVIQNVSLITGGTIDVNCGDILNVKKITGCLGDLLLEGEDNITFQSNNRLYLNSSTDILINEDVPLLFGTQGTLIQESNGTLLLNSNVLSLSTESVIIPRETAMTFTGSTDFSTSIIGDSTGDLCLLADGDIKLGNNETTSIKIPENIELQFGSSNQNISGNTNGIYINSESNNSNINLTANSGVNVISSSGNILLSSYLNDIVLNPINNTGSVRIREDRFLVFSETGTANSLINNNDTLSVLGNGDTNGSTLTINKFENMNLSIGNRIDIPKVTRLIFGNETVLTNNTEQEFYITNEDPMGSVVLTSKYLALSSTAGTLYLTGLTTNSISSGFNITTGTWSILANKFRVNATNACFYDPILTIGDYLQGTQANVTSDGKDKGIEFRYLEEGVQSNTNKLGWFGMKDSTCKFTFYKDAINNNEVISGTLGTIEAGNIDVENILLTITGGNLDLNCGNILNVRRITGCDTMDYPNGILTIDATEVFNISSGQVNITTAEINIPSETPINFGGTLSGSFIMGSNGNILISSGTTVFNSNVLISGANVNILSENVSILDSILTLGNGQNPNDSGIEFEKTNGTSGFFGFDESLNKFTYIPNATIANGIVSGEVGDVIFRNACLDNIILQSNGNISGIGELSGGEIDIISTIGNINISPHTGTGSIIIPQDTLIGFNSTDNNITNNSSNQTIITALNDIILNSGDKIILNASSGICISENTHLYFNTEGTKSIVGSSGDLLITNITGNILLTPEIGSIGAVLIPTGTPLGFNGNNGGGNGGGNDGNGTTESILATNGTLCLIAEDKVEIKSDVQVNGDLNIVGTLSASSVEIDINDFILPLGTSDIFPIISITENIDGNIKIETSQVNHLAIGDTLRLENTDSVPTIDGNYTVFDVINSTCFVVEGPTILTTGGAGSVRTDLKTNPGKDVGIQINYYDDTLVASGSAGFRTGFFGFDRTDLRWKFCSNATIESNIVTDCILGDIEINKLYATEINGFRLCGTLEGNTQNINGTNFDIDGGEIDNTPIGNNVPQTGRFTSLTSTINSSLQDVTLTGQICYSFERYIIDDTILQHRSPLTNVITSIVTVSSGNYVGTGTMPNVGVSDGCLKKITMSYIGDNSSYELYFGKGRLIAPNPCTSDRFNAEKMVFKRQGQSIEVMYDNTAGDEINGITGAWIVQSNGVCIM